MKLLCSFFFFVFLNISFLNAQNSFIKLFGISNYLSPIRIIPTRDGNLLIGATKYSPGNGSDIFLIKFNSNGDTIWTKTIGDHNWNDSPVSLDTTSDGGFVLAANRSPGGGNNRFCILKLDSAGNLEWLREFNCSLAPDLSNHTVAVNQASDGGFIVLGSAYKGAQVLDDDMVLIKLDNQGNFAWSKYYGTIYRERSRGLVVNNDGGFTFMCEYDNLINDDRAIGLINTDSSGNINWQKLIGLNDSIVQQIKFIEKSNDGGFLLLGYELYNANPLLIKTDLVGNVEWTKKYNLCPPSNCGGYGVSIKSMDNGQFVMLGTTSDKPFLINIDSSGNINWNKKYNLDAQVYNSEGFPWNLTINNNHFFFTLNSLNQTGILISKTDSLGNIDCYTNSPNFSDTSIITNNQNYTATDSSLSLTSFNSPVNEYPANECQLTVNFCYNGCQYVKRTSVLNGPSAVLIDSVYSYVLTCTPPASYYFWTASPGTIVSGQGTDSVSIQFDSLPTKIIVYDSTSCGLNPINCLVISTVGTVGINNLQNKNVITKIFPNPFIEQTKFLIKNVNNSFYPLSLLVNDLLGAEVKALNNIYSNEFDLKRENLKTGIYIYQIKSGNKVLTYGKLCIY